MKMKNFLIAAAAVFSSLAASAAVNAFSAAPPEKDPCKVPFYELESKDIVQSLDKSGVSLLLNIRLSEKSAVPASMKVIVGLTDCKGNQVFVSVVMKFNPSTGTWTGAQYLPGSSECPFTVNTSRIVMTNPCGDEYDSGDMQEANLKSGSGTLPARERIIARRRRS